MNKENIFTQSARELKNPRVLTACALLVALKLVLDALNIRVTITPSLRITFGFLANAMVGMLFGPVPAMLAGGAGDVIGYMLNSGGGAYFPGFTLTAILAGLVWGLSLYQKRVTFLRAILTKGFINLFLNILLNSFWLKLLYNKGMWAELPLRIAKNITMLPIEALLLVFMGGVVAQAYNRAKKGTS